MKKLSMVMIIAFTMISTSMHGLETSIEQHSSHSSCNTHSDHSNLHAHLHSHNGTSHQHSHSHGDSHSHSNTSYFHKDNVNNYLSNVELSSQYYQFQNPQLPNPLLKGIFRPPRS